MLMMAGKNCAIFFYLTTDHRLVIVSFSVSCNRNGGAIAFKIKGMFGAHWWSKDISFNPIMPRISFTLNSFYSLGGNISHLKLIKIHFSIDICKKFAKTSLQLPNMSIFNHPHKGTVGTNGLIQLAAWNGYYREAKLLVLLPAWERQYACIPCNCVIFV